MKLDFSRQNFEKYPNIKFRENLSSENKGIAVGYKDGRTNMKKLLVAFRNFANATTNRYLWCDAM